MQQRPVLLVLGLVLGSALAVHDSVLEVDSFTGFRVYRVLPTSREADLQQLLSLQESPFYDFWTEVTYLHPPPPQKKHFSRT
jgi:hypothetical protein